MRATFAFFLAGRAAFFATFLPAFFFAAGLAAFFTAFLAFFFAVLRAGVLAFAATGARILATLAKQLAQRGGGRGLISICTAGGMGVTAIVER